jgi:hypothetical protein
LNQPKYIFLSVRQLKRVLTVQWFTSSLMVLQTSGTVKAPKRRVQPPLHSRPKTVLSEEARNTLRLAQQEKYAQFKGDLDAAWHKINDVTHSIAATHSKSVHCVHTELHLGHMWLQNKRLKVNSWNAFCWKKCCTECAQNKGNSKLSICPPMTTLSNYLQHLPSQERERPLSTS